MAFLDNNIVNQLKGLFDKITSDIKIMSFLGDNDKSLELDGFLKEFSDISDNIKYESKIFNPEDEHEKKYGIKRDKSFTIIKDGNRTGINFYGIPGGHEFNSLVLAILGLAGLGKKMEDEKVKKVQSISKSLDIEIFVSLSCTHCPDVVQALNLITINNSLISSSMVDSGVFSEEASEKDIQAVPTVFVNGQLASIGAKTPDELIDILILI